jgi:hypothetical protein
MRYSVSAGQASRKVALLGTSGKLYEFSWLSEDPFIVSDAETKLNDGIAGVYSITCLRGNVAQSKNHTVIYVDESADIKTELAMLRQSALWGRFKKQKANCLLVYRQPSVSVREQIVADLASKHHPTCTRETDDPLPPI